MCSELVSIIIPLYNTEKYIARTINSALAQTYSNLEILVIDDGSTDRGVEICRTFEDPRLRIIQQPNRGLPGARNTGIRNSKGQYIALLDADDLWLPEKVEKHVKHFQNNPSVGISFSCSAFIDENDVRTGLHQIPRKMKDLNPSYMLCRNPIGNGSAAVIRREVFEEIKYESNLHGTQEDYFFDENLRFKKADATDLECWTRISAQTKWKVEGISESLTLYRVNSGGLSSNAMAQFEALEAGLDKLCEAYPEALQDHKKLALSYYSRYVARRAVISRDKKLALRMANKALLGDVRILLEEPQRTLVTCIAAYALALSPASLYTRLESIGLKIVSMLQASNAGQNA